MTPKGDSGATPAVIYAAKSTEDKHASIPTQIEEAREMAEEQGWLVVYEDQDEGFSAYSGNRGPGLERAKAAAVQAAQQFGTPCMLIAQAHDRFARGSGDAPGAPQHLVELWIELRRSDVHLRTVEDDFDMRDVQSVAAIGQRAMMDSRRKSKSVKKGMARRKALGLHNGRASYGYRNEKGRWLIDPAEAAIVERIFREWVGGVSQYTITQRLNDPKDPVRPRLGKEWSQGTVSALLRKPVYAGLGEDGEACRCGHEPIIDAETFAQAQALLGGRHRAGGPNRRTAAGHLFLNGYLRCGLCGSPLAPRTDKRRDYETYICSAPRNRGAGSCGFKSIRRDILERGIVEHFTSARVDLRGMIERHDRAVSGHLEEVAARRAQAEREVMRATERLARVRRDYQDGALTAADWNEMRDELGDELDAATQHADQLKQQESSLKLTLTGRDAEQEVLTFLAEARGAILAPVRDAETMDALRVGFRQIWPGFVVYPAGSKEARAFGSGGLVLVPCDRDGRWMSATDAKVTLPMPARTPTSEAWRRSRRRRARRRAGGRPRRSAR